MFIEVFSYLHDCCSSSHITSILVERLMLSSKYTMQFYSERSSQTPNLQK